MSKNFTYLRHQFESAGGRVIPIANIVVAWPGGKECRASVRLQARPGSEGDIDLIIEDLNKDGSLSTRKKLRKAN